MAKTRTIVWRGVITSGMFQVTTEAKPPPPAFPPGQYWMDLGVPEITFGALGFQVRAYIDWTFGPLFKSNLLFTKNSQWSSATQIGSSFASSSTLSVSGAVSESIDWQDSEITITAEVEEVLVIQTDTAWPSAFGTLVKSGPRKRRAVYRERLVLDSTVEIRASVGGASLSVDIEVDAAHQFWLEAADITDTNVVPYSAICTARAFATPIGTTAQIVGTIEFGSADPILLSCPLSGSAHGHSVGGSSASAVAPSGVRHGAIHMSQGTTTIWPLRVWRLRTYFRAWQDAYPESIDLRVDRKAGQTNVLISAPVDGTSADHEQQERYSGSGMFADSSYAAGPFVGDTTQGYSAWSLIGWSTSGITQPTSVSKNDWLDFRCGIDSAWLIAKEEEPLDWRCLVQLPSQVAGTLTHDAAHIFEDGTETWANVANCTGVTNAGGYVVIPVSGGAGHVQRVFASDHEQAPKYDMQAGVDIEIVLQCDTPNESAILEIDGKEWTVNVTTANADTILVRELRSPYNASADTDSTQSRYPVGTEGIYFGVNAAAHIALKELTDGVTWKIGQISLKRKSESRVSFGLPVDQWVPSGGGSDYLRHVTGVGKKLDFEIPGMYRTPLPTGEYVYGFPDLAAFFGAVEVRPGWSKTEDGDIDQSLPLLWLCGLHGVFWHSDVWHSGMNQDAASGVALIMAEAVDEIYWYPYMGEMGGPYGQETIMPVGKTLRGRMNVYVNDRNLHKGLPAAEIALTGGASVPETLTTDAEGFTHSTSRKYGRHVATLGAHSVSVNIANRHDAWAGFGSASDEKQPEARDPFALTTRWGDYCKTYIAGEEEERRIYFWRTSLATPGRGWIVEAALVVDSKDACMPAFCFQHQERIILLFALCFGTLSDVYEVKSDDGGQSWGSPEIVFPGGKYPFPAYLPHEIAGGVLRSAWIEEKDEDGEPAGYGYIHATWQAQGDPAPSAEYVFQYMDGGTPQPIPFEPDRYAIVRGAEGPDRWLLLAVVYQEGAPSEWRSADDGQMWERIA